MTAAAAGRFPLQPTLDPILAMSATRRPVVFSTDATSSPQSAVGPQRVGRQQHLGRFAEARLAGQPRNRGQFFHCRLYADALCPSRDLPVRC